MMQNNSKFPAEHMLRFHGDPVANARKALSVVTSRIRRIEQLSRRLLIEGQPIPTADYLTRLRECKRQLTKKIQEASEPRVKHHRHFVWFFPLPDVHPAGPFPSGSMSISEYVRGVEHTSLSEVAEILGVGECSKKQGFMEPFVWRGMNVIDFIEHGSKVKFVIYDDRFCAQGNISFEQSLYDDAAWWRNDTPDGYPAGIQIYWELPVPDCDVEVTCFVGVEHWIKLENFAIDGGGFYSYVSLSHSDENGAFSVGGPFFSTVMLGDPSADEIPSTWVCKNAAIGTVFLAKRGTIVRLCLEHCCVLWAQDGLVQAFGDTYTFKYDPQHPPNARVLGPPLLTFSMAPLG